MTTGTIVKLKVPCLGNPPGTKGVCFYNYGDGCQFIFENGSYDGFSCDPDRNEQEMFLEEIGFSTEIFSYQFKNVIQVSEDFRKGLFDKALK